MIFVVIVLLSLLMISSFCLYGIETQMVNKSPGINLTALGKMLQKETNSLIPGNQLLLSEITSDENCFADININKDGIFEKFRRGGDEGGISIHHNLVEWFFKPHINNFLTLHYPKKRRI